MVGLRFGVAFDFDSACVALFQPSGSTSGHCHWLSIRPGPQALAARPTNRSHVLITQEELQAARVIYGLIRNSTTQAVIKEFLKRRSLAHSAANAEELYERRILPALEAETITVDDLRNLLRASEECGRQHIFLYHCAPDRATQLIEERRVRRVATEEGVDSLLSSPLDLELPANPTLVDIRLEHSGSVVSALVIKQVETRSIARLLETSMNPGGDRLSKIYHVEKRRAVNIARLSRNGQLEIRIASQDNMTRYTENVIKFFGAIAPFVPRSEFHEVSISHAKAQILNQQDELKGLIRYGNSEAANDFGYKLGVSSITHEGDIFDDAGVKEGLRVFLDQGGMVKSTNLYFIMPESEPRREVHVLLSGAHNEFAIPVGCTPEDFDYVCGKIREFNR